MRLPRATVVLGAPAIFSLGAMFGAYLFGRGPSPEEKVQISAQEPRADCTAQERLTEYLRQLPSRPEKSAAPLGASPSEPDLIAEALSSLGERQVLPRNPFSEAVSKLMEDGTARSELLARLAREADPELRAKIVSLLSFVTTHDVERAAVTSTRAAGARQRQEGFMLLRHNGSRTARQAVLDSLEHEEDPDVLAAALQSLQPLSGATPRDAQQVASQVRPLLGHDSSEVRANALIAVGRVDHSASALDDVLAGLTDSEDEVREAALTALVESNTRAPVAKEKLLTFVRSTELAPELRRRAQDLLGHFVLDEDELAVVQIGAGDEGS